MADEDVEQIVQSEQTESSVDTNDPVQVNEARKRAGRKRVSRLHFVQAAMDTPQGRAWFHDFLLSCNMFSSPFSPGASDVTNFRLGEMNVGLRILADIQKVAPKQYLDMLKENK